MSELARIRQQRSHIYGKPPFAIRVNASRGQKMSRVHRTGGPHLLRKFQNSKEEGLKEEKKLYYRRIRKREQREGDFAGNTDFLQALGERDCIFEAQAAILGKLAAEENYLKGLSEACRVGLTLEPFPERVKEVEEAITMLKY